MRCQGYFLKIALETTFVPVRNKKKEYLTTEFCILALLFVPKTKLTVFILWTKFICKVYFQFKTNKMSITTEFYIFELVWILNFSLTDNFDFFYQICSKRVLPI